MSMGAAELNKQVGRKKHSGQREASGRLCRSLRDEISQVPGALAKRLIDASMRNMADREWGTPIGQLFLRGRLSHEQFEAGKRWDNLARIYYAAIQAPKSPQSIQLGVHSQEHTPDPDSDEGRKQAARREKIILARWSANTALVAAGRGLYEVVCDVCEGQQLPDPARLDALKRGLDALIAWWDLTNEKL